MMVVRQLTYSWRRQSISFKNARLPNLAFLFYYIIMNIIQLVDTYGVDRVAKMKNVSTNQIKKKYLRARDGVERKTKPRKPKVKR